MGKLLTLTGKVHLVENKQTFASGFEKQVCVITEEADKYPQTLPFEFLKEKIEMLDKVQRGDRVTVTYSERGSEYNNRYYVNLVAFKIEVIGKGSVTHSDSIEEDVDMPVDESGEDLF